MESKNFIVVERIERFLYLITVGLILLLISYGSIAPAAAAGSEAHLKGEFGPLHNWPIVPIHMALLPDGRVFAFGTKMGKLKYTIWNPYIGIGTDAFETLPNITDTNIFCSGQAFIPGTGQALLIGGTNLSSGDDSDDVNIFDPATETLTPQTQSMAFTRWYATAVTLPNGEHVALGGRRTESSSGTSATYSSTPEVRAADGNWRTLSSAVSDSAYGASRNSWNYPRAWVNPQGSVFILTYQGLMYKLDTSGTGTLSQYTKKTSGSNSNLPSVMFAPGRILSLRNNRVATVVDINGTGEPVLSSGGNLIKDRKYSNATVLADGRVWVNGGSSTGNDLTGAALDSELWDPATRVWTTVASAATARLYHSASLLLPDGTVLTGGGGNPGPIRQLNGEIYYPPYLFKADGTGELAPRPEVVDAPTNMIGWDQEFSVEATDPIAKVTLVRVGVVTHTFNNEQRFFDLPISQTDNIVSVRSPASANIAPPGFYLLFVWNASGTPSIAKFLHIG
ncbi:galactose oxidase-like domain-containing protein [Nitrosomonas sp. Nm166]|uniref:galactose oxidase-like domain-containing protein n=1 Tax=Nitrosomonas sp. Nm166 TaxID=1881054 RepID=UPI000B812E34|nr:galactose oxidase-like domain-containing protein [Nitrosomonas sp. Nm166]